MELNNNEINTEIKYKSTRQFNSVVAAMMVDPFFESNRVQSARLDEDGYIVLAVESKENSSIEQAYMEECKKGKMKKEWLKKELYDNEDGQYQSLVGYNKLSKKCVVANECGEEGEISKSRVIKIMESNKF